MAQSPEHTIDPHSETFGYAWLTLLTKETQDPFPDSNVLHELSGFIGNKAHAIETLEQYSNGVYELLHHPEPRVTPAIERGLQRVALVKDHLGVLCKAWNAEMILFGSLSHRYANKADVDLIIVSERDAMPQGVIRRIEDTVTRLIGIEGTDLWMVSVDGWRKNLSDPIALTNPIYAQGLYTESLAMAPILWGVPEGLQKPKFHTNLRKKLFDIAREYPHGMAVLASCTKYTYEHIIECSKKLR